MSSDSESKREKNPAKNADLEKDQARRNVLKGGVVVGGAAVAAALAPKKWTRPIVDAVIVSANAQTSPGAPTPAPTSAPTPPPTPMPTPSPTPGGF